MKKPYKYYDDLTAHMIQTDPYFKGLSVSQLARIIRELPMSQLRLLPGLTYKKRAEKILGTTQSELKPVKKIYTYNSYYGYRLRRTKTLLKFGCGAVVIQKKDLLLAADFMNKIGQKDTDKNIMDYALNCDKTGLRYNSVPIENILRAATIIKTPGYAVIERLSLAAGRHLTFGDLFRISADDYRLLAE